jgi:hypothetical protein
MPPMEPTTGWEYIGIDVRARRAVAKASAGIWAALAKAARMLTKRDVLPGPPPVGRAWIAAAGSEEDARPWVVFGIPAGRLQ